MGRRDVVRLVPGRVEAMWWRSPLAFLLERRRRFRNHPACHVDEIADPILAALARDGIVVLPRFHSQADVDALHDTLREVAERVKTGDAPGDWDVVAYPSDGIYRVRDIEAIVPQCRALLAGSATAQIVRSYLQGEPRRTTYVDYKPDVGVHDNTTVPHMDNCWSQVKVFTLLHDVGPDQAPLVYWKRSHRPGRWRLLPDFLNFIGHRFGGGGVCPPDVLVAEEEGGSIEMVTVTGEAGTVAVMDARGFHRASNLNAGYRLQLVEAYQL